MNAFALALGGAVAAATGFVAAEFAARAWLARRGRAFVWPPFARTRMSLDPETFPTLDPVVEHRVNADGERGDPAPHAGEDLFRVLVAGGSAAECWYIDQDATWPHVVQETLRAPENLARLGAERVHVGNVARSLVSARHVDQILSRILPNYERLDAIVFMVGASDVLTWLERGAPRTVDESPIPSSALFAQHPDRPFGWTAKSLALRRIASAWNRRVRSPIDVRERAGRRLGDARRMRENALEIVREMPDPAPMLAAFDRWFASLLERAIVKADHVLVVHQPWLERDFTPEEARLMWNFGAGRPYAGLVTRYYAHEVGWRLHELVDERVSVLARRAGIAELDLMSIVPGDFAHYYDDHHHTPRGCALIGRAVAHALVEVVEGSRAVPAPTAFDPARSKPAPRPKLVSRARRTPA